MVRNDDLEALRREVLARHDAATKKVSRLRRVAGVELGGTEFDPRVGPNAIRRMNTRQAVRHLAKLNSFTSRRTRFVSGAEMSPIPLDKWRQYKQLEAKNRQLGQKDFQRVANIKLPNGQTIAEYDEQMSPKGFKSVGYNKGNKAFIKGERTSSNIRGVKGLDKIIENINRKNSTRYPQKVVKQAKENMIATLEGGGVSDAVIKKASKLTKFQTDVLWNHTKFARDAGEKYWFTANEKAGGTVRPTTSHADMESKLDEQIEWASRLQEPETPQTPSPRRRRR